MNGQNVTTFENKGAWDAWLRECKGDDVMVLTFHDSTTLTASYDAIVRADANHAKRTGVAMEKVCTER